MEDNNKLEIGVETLCQGNKVNVRWLGQWYEGTVITLGPQKNLCKLKVGQDETVLMDPSLLKPIDRSLPTHQQLSIGAQVAFYNNDMEKWVDATIENDKAVGMVLVRWQRTPQSSNPNTSWFEVEDVAVIIANEAYGLTAAEHTSAFNGVSSLEDILEERPRHRANEGYQDDSIDPLDAKLPPLPLATSEHQNRQMRTSTSMKYMYESNRQSAESTSDKRLASLQRARSNMLNPYALLRGKLDQSNRSAVQSFKLRAGGIPHHPASKFFRNTSQNKYLPPATSLTTPSVYVSHGPVNTIHDTPTHASSTGIRRTHSAMFPLSMHRSPTTFSDAHSESAGFAGKPLTHSSSGPAIQMFPHERMMPHQFSNRPLPELPGAGPGSSSYEVPVSIKHVYAEVERKAPWIDYKSCTPSQMNIELGGSTVMKCQVISDTPVTYEWRKNELKVSQNDEHIAIPAPGELQLYAITLAEAGIYKCIATNDAGTATYTCQLKVNEGLSAKEFGGDVTESTPSETDEQGEAQDNRQTKSTARMPVPQIFVEGVSMDVEEAKDDEKTNLADFPSKKHKGSRTRQDKHQHSKVTFSDMDQYLEGYGEDYGALSTQSDVMLQDDQDSIDIAAVRKLRFNMRGRRISREEQPVKSKSTSSLDKTVETEDLTKLVCKPQRTTETSNWDQDTPQTGVGVGAQPAIADANGAAEPENQVEITELKTSHSEDSMDAHMSYESSSSKSDQDDKGVQLPLAEQHYTEGIRRLQLSHDAYEKEHFGKITPKKRGFLGLFSSKTSKPSKKKKNKKVTFT